MIIGRLEVQWSPVGGTDSVVQLALPRWDFATAIDLGGALQQLGLVKPFTPAADFSAMTPNPVVISQAIHRATITVDEWGTEAAAVTGIAFAVSAPPPPEVTVRADRPFGFAIVHTPTGAPLFLGHVADPAASDLRVCSDDRARAYWTRPTMSGQGHRWRRTIGPARPECGGPVRRN